MLIFDCCHGQEKKGFVEPKGSTLTLLQISRVNLKLHHPCPYCRIWPCFMDKDDNYERLLVLGTSLEGKGWHADQIRLAVQSEMTYHYNISVKMGSDIPYCVEREIIDAYPPTKESRILSRKHNNKHVII